MRRDAGNEGTDLAGRSKQPAGSAYSGETGSARELWAPTGAGTLGPYHPTSLVKCGLMHQACSNLITS